MSHAYIHKTFISFKESITSIRIEDLPETLYHVTTNYKAVMDSGVLLAKSGLDSGGLGGIDDGGVSFVSDRDIAVAIKNELSLINSINNCSNEECILEIINGIVDIDRRDFILSQYNYTKSIYKDPYNTALMALRLSRFSNKFSGRLYKDMVIFFEQNIKGKDIGIVSIDKNQIPIDAIIKPGVDKDLGEIRIFIDIPLNKY